MQGSVLVVEHDAATRDLVVGNFRNAGYSVLCARGFNEADTLVRANRPDVALLDWIPGASGLIFARQLRRDTRTADAAIIMMGCRADNQDAVAALESGADDYVAKPVAMRELIARVKAVLRRRAPQLADGVIEISGLTFDPAARRVTAEGRDIEMRNTEFNLLHFLITHPNRIFSRRQLLDEIWGDRVFVEERTVDVHVRRLRCVLAPTHDTLVETVRGVGYRFCADTQPATNPVRYSIVASVMTARSLGPQVAVRQVAAA